MIKLKELKPIRIKDLTAPRWVTKKFNVLSRSSLKIIKEQNKEQLKGVDIKTIKNIAEDFNRYTIEWLLEHRDSVELPYMMGDIWIAVFGKGGKVDYVKSEEVGKELRYRNGNTDGFGIKLFYTADYILTSTVIHRAMWVLKPHKYVGTKIKEKVMSGEWKNLMVTKNPKFLKEMIRSIKNKNVHKTTKKQKFEAYDPFYINPETE